MINAAFGWLWILAGLVSGALLGLFFRRENWLGGYASLPRRLVRLGHISFLGLGMLNVLFALSAPWLHLKDWQAGAASWGLIAGGVSMPAVCGLSAWNQRLVPLFVVPVACLIAAVAWISLNLCGL